MSRSSISPLVRSVTILALLAAAALVVVLAFQKRQLQAEIAELRQRTRLEGYVRTGDVVPPFTAATLAGDSVVIGAGEPGERQVLFVFNTTCGWCLRTLPVWKALGEKLDASHGPAVSVFGISFDPEEETRAYVAEHELAFPVLGFPDERTPRLYRIGGVPMTLVLDHEGEVRYARMGSLIEGHAALDSIRVAAAGSISSGPRVSSR